jgi:hypothetical protein
MKNTFDACAGRREKLLTLNSLGTSMGYQPEQGLPLSIQLSPKNGIFRP